jgi:hypothetical protein
MSNDNIKFYEGIDFANKERNVGRCCLHDDGRRLIASFESPETPVFARSAVDCPLGTSAGFHTLLSGDLPEYQSRDGFKTRTTERWLRDQLATYATNQRWRDRNRDEKDRFPRRSYFNRSQHVQPTLRLEIVPACLDWLVRQLVANGTKDQRLEALAEARRGEARIVEAHPRPFLYSAVERLYRQDANVVDLSTLNAAAGYKGSREYRCTVYQLLRDNQVWMGESVRHVLPRTPPEALLNSDHAFDAWLCALTAWAHNNGETLSWDEVAEITRRIVGIEGHILVLSQME